MKQPVIVLGAGGHARVLLDVLRLTHMKILGVTDARPSAVDRQMLRVSVLGNDETVFCHSPKNVQLVNGLGSTGITPKRAELFKKFKLKGYRFASVIHPSAIIAGDVILGEGVQIMAGAVLQPGGVLGQNTIINTRVSVDHDCRIGAHVHLAPGVVLSGGVTVGDGSHIGTGAVIVQKVMLPENSFVKAASLVSMRNAHQWQRKKHE